MRALFIDFEDSFSYNVVQELTLTGFEVTVLHWQDFEELPTEGALVLGPGPGHPDDYERIFPLVRNWLGQGKPFLGVCLGHQILWRLQGEEVLRSRLPLHGQKVLLDLNSEWRRILKIPDEVYVQRYNSLAVFSHGAVRNPQFRNFIQEDEILITTGEHLLSYQFHPESIGTTYRRQFFQAAWCILGE